MSETPLDYARFGRQLALREVGPDGQRALARVPARFTGENAALASLLHGRAGGAVGDHDGARSYDTGKATQPALALGLAAYAALESARFVLELGPARDALSEALRARLTLEDATPPEPR